MPHDTLTLLKRSPGRPAISGTYLITDHSADMVRKVSDAIGGGVSTVQFRHKGGDQLNRLRKARELRDLCRKNRVTFIVNDDISLARAVDADGVHLGQEDGTVQDARALLGESKIIGVSTHSADEARRAEEAGADYVGLGAMYPTGSKRVDHLIGPEALTEVRSCVSIPIVAIGGITRDNAPLLIDRGADAVAVISAVMDSPAPRIAARELNLLFNRRLPHPRGTVLTVAGSDSGGGAGIQADIKTITLLGSYAASVITALTAQNTRGVTGIHPVPAPFVAEQIDAVCSDIPVHVVKTGMLADASIVTAVAERLERYGIPLTVVDPVMIAKGGAALIDDRAIGVMIDRLLPLTYLLTPNIPEAERLTGIRITDERSMQEAAEALHRMGPAAVLLKGGHLSGDASVDFLVERGRVTPFEAPRILTRNTHGTGCTLSSAIAAFLAQGLPLPEAVASAKGFISDAIETSCPLGKGHGPVNHYGAAQRRMPAAAPDGKENGSDIHDRT